MSDLTASAWSASTVEKLRHLEETCPDNDLFCVGYLIPQVELVEIEYAEEAGSLSDWQARFQSYVEGCLIKDGVTGDDRSRILELTEAVSA